MIGAYHAVAVLAFMPGYFSWSGLVVAILGTHLCGLFGINLCYHRLLTHRGLKCPEMAGACHGRHRDVLPAGNTGALGRDSPPPPSIRRRTAGPAHARWPGFFWSHIGWILVHQPELSRLGIYERYAKDILRDRFYVALERHNWLVWINLLQMPLFFAAGFAVGMAVGRNAGSGGADRT